MKLFLLFTVLSIACYGQNIKIGDLAISDSLAKEYFLDCHVNPNVYYYMRNTHLPTGFWSGNTEEYLAWQKITRREYLDIKNYKSAGVALKTDTVPRTPSASDFAAFMRRKYNNP